jgi:FMN phosphatase YigB (HAD superfamily)
VFLLDVDNTLLDNDRFGADLDARLRQQFGATGCDRYWRIYDERRAALGYADYLGSLQAFRDGLEGSNDLLQLGAWMLDYPFARRLYPHALEVIARLRTLGTVAILSDGDIVFQPRKIQRSGLWDAVEGHVLITLHKQLSVAYMQQRFPASHYVMVDDKPQVLATMKRLMAGSLTTIFVRQGHYAVESFAAFPESPPDLRIERIAELLDFDFNGRLGAPGNST